MEYSTRFIYSLSVVLLGGTLLAGGCSKDREATNSVPPIPSNLGSHVRNGVGYVPPSPAMPRPVAEAPLSASPGSLSASLKDLLEMDRWVTGYHPIAAAFSPDSRWVAGTRARGEQKPYQLFLFDVARGALKSRRNLAPETQKKLVWSAPDRLFATGKRAQAWKVSSQGALTPIVTFAHPAHLRSHAVAFGSVEPWKEKPTYGLLSTAVSPAHQLGVRLLEKKGYRGWNSDGWQIELFNTKTRRPLRTITPRDYRPISEQPLQISMVDPARLLVSESTGNLQFHFSLWEPRQGRQLWRKSFKGLDVHLDWTPDARLMAVTQVTGSHGRDVFPLHDTVLLDAATGRQLRKLPTQHTVYSAAITNRVLATFGTEIRAEKKQWWTSLQLTDLRTGRRLMKCWMPPRTSRVMTLAISPDGRYIAGCNVDGLLLWRVADLKQGRGTFKNLTETLDERESEAAEVREVE